MIDRLEARGWIERRVSPGDKRVRLLALTAAGTAHLKKMQPAMLRAQERMLAPLPKAERAVFMSMVQRVVAGNNAWSRAAKDV